MPCTSPGAVNTRVKNDDMSSALGEPMFKGSKTETMAQAKIKFQTGHAIDAGIDTLNWDWMDFLRQNLD